jgi:ribosomal protein S7
MFRDSSLEIEVLQDMLEDMVPVMEVIVTEEMFAHYRKAVDYAMKTWV